MTLSKFTLAVLVILSFWDGCDIARLKRRVNALEHQPVQSMLSSPSLNSTQVTTRGVTE